MRALLCLLGVVPAALAAQQPTDTVTLNPVIVTATRIPTAASAVPAAVTVITSARLREQGIHTVFEALADVPGAAVFQTGSFGGQTSLFLRGGQSKYVKVLVDGVPVNQPGGAFDFANLTTDNVERIEVLRGPASVLYGSDAVTGVVQIFTRRGSDNARADATVRGGTYGTLIWDAEASGGGQQASYSFAVSRHTSNGRYADNTYHFPTNGAGQAVDPYQFNYGSGPTIALDVGHYFTPRLEARLLLAASEADGGVVSPPDSANDSTLFHNLDNLRRASADLRANLYLPGGTVLTGGAAVEQQRDRSFNLCQSPFGDCTTPPIDTSRWNGALYAQVVSEIAGRVSLTTGVRLEDNERFGTYATYRAGAAYRLPGGTRLRATAGNGFREPAFSENYSTGYSVGNPNLKPEHSRSWEVGVEQSVGGGRASASATFFDQRFIDMIDYNPNAPLGASNYANVAGATASGVEVGIRARPAGAVSLGASYTYLYTDVTSVGYDSTAGAALAAGQPLLRRPKHAARLDADYRLPERGTVSLAVTYVGDRIDRVFPPFPAPPRRVALPSYTRVDLAAQLDVLRPRAGAPGLALMARVENLFDRVYEEVKNFPARRRTLLFGGQVRFGS